MKRPAFPALNGPEVVWQEQPALDVRVQRRDQPIHVGRQGLGDAVKRPAGRVGDAADRRRRSTVSVSAEATRAGSPSAATAKPAARPAARPAAGRRGERPTEPPTIAPPVLRIRCAPHPLDVARRRAIGSSFARRGHRPARFIAEAERRLLAGETARPRWRASLRAATRGRRPLPLFGRTPRQGAPDSGLPIGIVGPEPFAGGADAGQGLLEGDERLGKELVHRPTRLPVGRQP